MCIPADDESWPEAVESAGFLWWAESDGEELRNGHSVRQFSGQLCLSQLQQQRGLQLGIRSGAGTYTHWSDLSKFAATHWIKYTLMVQVLYFYIVYRQF